MAPPTLENCEETLQEIITLRKQEGYYRQTMQELRLEKKFLAQLWNYANRANDLVDHYKVVVRNYQIAMHDMSHRENTATQSDEVMDFYKAASLYITETLERNKKAKSQSQKAKPLEQERNAAMFKPCTLLHIGSINEFHRSVLRTEQHQRRQPHNAMFFHHYMPGRRAGRHHPQPAFRKERQDLRRVHGHPQETL